MKLLIISQYFPPEVNAPAHRLGFFAKYLSEKENTSVTVICEPPNYPRGVLFDGYKNKLLSREKMGNAEVLRTCVWITKKKDFINRSLNYFSFFFSSVLAGLRVEKPDIILASSPPLPVLFSGFFISKIRHVPLVIEIRDIWPDSVVAVGMMKKNLIFKFLELLEKFIYRSSKKIVVNAEGIGERLEKNKRVQKEKIVFIPNGAELDFFSPNIKTNSLDEKYKLGSSFVVLFIGLIGLAQNPEIIVKTAEKLRDRKDIVFLIVGDGAEREKCEKLARYLRLENIIFAGEKPRNEMPTFVSRADVALITLKNMDLFYGVISSKIFDYMSAEKPIIINIDGETAKIIKDARCGLIAEPENPESLAEKILELYQNEKLRGELGENGRKYAKLHYDKNKIAEDLLSLLNSVLTKEKSG